MLPTSGRFYTLDTVLAKLEAIFNFLIIRASLNFGIFSEFVTRVIECWFVYTLILFRMMFISLRIE